jgi:hypothetical protein
MIRASLIGDVLGGGGCSSTSEPGGGGGGSGLFIGEVGSDGDLGEAIEVCVVLGQH